MAEYKNNYQKYKHNYNFSEQNDWLKANRERINIIVPKGMRDAIKQYSKERGFKSTNALITHLIAEDMKKHGFDPNDTNS